MCHCVATRQRGLRCGKGLEQKGLDMERISGSENQANSGKQNGRVHRSELLHARHTSFTRVFAETPARASIF